MTSFVSAAVRGAAAGAAGTTALNAVTYLDMAWRGRPASSTPEDTVEKLAHTAGLEVPGDDATRQNRLAGLGPLTGIATGVGVGVVAGLLARRDPPLPVLAGLVGAVAMAGANGPMTALRITDPRQWSPADWISDVVPHLAYGFVTAAVARGLVRAR
jgi:xanthosine utilization system XapX-like protein